MVTAHGRKRYFQVLLDPNRAGLLENMAAQKGVKATALAREAIYRYLSENVPQKYPQAEHLDGLMWKQSVSNRIAGRKKKKAESQ